MPDFASGVVKLDSDVKISSARYCTEKPRKKKKSNFNIMMKI
jgi:hypothetical protein